MNISNPLTKKGTIYIIDYLGAHAESNVYAGKLRKLLAAATGYDVEIVSNYSTVPGQEPMLVNQYTGGVLNQAFSLYRNYRRLSKLLAACPDDVYIFISYGNQIDISFLRIVGGARRHVIDVQDVVAAREAESELMVYNFAKTYAQRVENVISHCRTTDDFLDSIGFTGRIFNLPYPNEEVDIDAVVEKSLAQDTSGLNDREKEIYAFLQNFNTWLNAADD